jgi:hypothetical protein
MADLTGDGKLEILTVIEGPGGYGNILRAYTYDGSILWTVTAACCFRNFRTPAIADVDLDGTLDVFSIAADDGDQEDEAYLLHGATGASFTGWPFDLSGYGRNKWSLSDVDGNEDLEIIIHAMEGFNHDGTVAAGYPKAKGANGTIADVDGKGSNDWFATLSVNPEMGGVDLDINPLPGWPVFSLCGQPLSLPSICDINNDGLLEMGFSSISNGCVSLYNHDGTAPTGWPVIDGNFSCGFETVIGDTDNDGMLNFIVGCGEEDFSPTGKILNYNEDAVSATDFPWMFAHPADGTGLLTDLDLDGDVELGMPMQVSGTTQAALFFWDLPAPYNPLNMHWRMAGGNMQHTGEWHPPSYYVPQVNTLSPALTWVTSCPVGTLQCSGASFESKPFVWFVPSADAPLFYGGDLSKGIPAVAVAQPQIHPVTALPQNPLNATYIEVTPPALALGSYELVIQNPTGIRNMVKPVITVTDDVGASVTPVGDTLMVDFGPTPSELAFDWGDVGNAEYVVIYDTAPDGAFGDEAGRTTTNALTTESPAGTDLFFQVVGVNSCGLGP